LALIVKQQPKSMAQLSEIDGLGQAKIKQYGQLILDQLSQPIKTEKTPSKKKADDSTAS
jgi:superfamily II DNA helicase RecQ